MIKYYVSCCKNDVNRALWLHRNHKSIKATEWQEIDEEKDDVEEIIRTHKYVFETFPDNDDFHLPVEYNVDIKKITITSEIL